MFGLAGEDLVAAVERKLWVGRLRHRLARSARGQQFIVSGSLVCV